jgi:hypothetical protein
VIAGVADTFYPVTFDGEEYDSLNLIGASPTNVPVTQSGYYDIAVTVNWAISTAGTRYFDVRAGGTVIFADTRAPVPHTGLGSDQTWRDIRWINAGQNITVGVESFGASVNCTGVSLMVAKVSATGPGTVGPGTWTTLPGAPNWVAHDATNYPCQLRRNSMGEVFCRGALRNVAGFAFGGVNSVIAYIPVGFRPEKMMITQCVDSDPTNGGRPIGLQMYSTGEMYVINIGSAGVTGGIGSAIWIDNVSWLGV